jgi:phosphate butyryltransferase
MMIHDLTELITRAKERPKRRIAVAAAEDENVLKSLQSAMNEGIIIPILVGCRNKVEQIAQQINFDLDKVEIIDNRNRDVNSVALAVELIRDGEADFLMKGLVQTGDLLRGVLDKEKGLPIERLLSHVALFQSPYYHKVFCVTDVAMNIAPDLEAKVKILNNAVSVFHQLRIENPKVAVAAAVEYVNPKMEATVHAAEIKKMNVDGEIKGCIVDGPLAVDIAFNKDAAVHKGIKGEVAGDCDIVLMPDIEAGNMVYKTLNFIGGAKSASIITGASVPIVLTSRSDDDKTKLLSIALASLMV